MTERSGIRILSITTTTNTVVDSAKQPIFPCSGHRDFVMSIYQCAQSQIRRQCQRGPLAVSSSRSMSSMFGFGSSETTKAPKKEKVETVNKQAIIQEVATAHDLSFAKADRIVNTVFDTIVEAVVEGKQARLPGFGAFDSYISKPKGGTNPYTGETIEIPSKRRIRFKAFEAFKNAK